MGDPEWFGLSERLGQHRTGLYSRCMTKPQASSKPKSTTAAASGQIDPYKALLARVAGSVTAGLIQNPSPALKTPGDYAAVSVDFAREILQNVGIQDPEAA